MNNAGTPLAKLPSFVRDLLEKPPRAGEGVHAWLFRTARHLHAHLPAVEIVSLLQAKVANCGRSVPEEEIKSAVQQSIGCAWRPSMQGQAVRQITRWPELNQKRRESVIKEGGGLADLWELSPVRFEDHQQHTEEIIDRFFPGNPLLCCGKSSSQFATRPREAWRGELANHALIVPSPMSTLTGVTKDGKQSSHTLSNTGPRRFLICEFDSGSADDHAALLIHLAGYAPLVCAVHSGGKSLHSWFFVDSQAEQKVHRFFRYAVSLGADRATWTRSQFVRMPDGTRDNGARQTVFFLNPEPLQ